MVAADTDTVPAATSACRAAIAAADAAVAVLRRATSASMSAAVAAIVASSVMMWSTFRRRVCMDAASPVSTARSAAVNLLWDRKLTRSHYTRTVRNTPLGVTFACPGRRVPRRPADYGLVGVRHHPAE